MQQFRLCYSSPKAKEQNNIVRPRVRKYLVIDRLVDNRSISCEQYDAACRFYNDYYQANYFKLIKARGFVEVRQKTNNYNQIEGSVAAKQNYERARKSLTKEELAVIDWVVIDDKFLKYYHKSKGAHDILRPALDILIKCYSYKKL